MRRSMTTLTLISLLWMKQLFGKTCYQILVDKDGKKTNDKKTTGNEKAKVSVCLAAEGDGTKLKLYIILCGHKREAKKLKEDFRTECVIQSSSNGWMNDDLTLHWVHPLKNVLPPYAK